MRFLRLTTERFGSLPDQAWEFEEGFQLVQGANEAGKSSLQQGLTWALYGDATSSHQKYLGRRRWGEADHFTLELVLDVRGHQHRLVRDFQARHNWLFLPDGKRISSKEQIREWVAKTLQLPTEASFTATACVCQDELAVDAKGGNLQSLLEQHVLSGSGTNVDLLLRRLKDRLQTLNLGRFSPAKHFGPIKSRDEEIRRAEEELRRLKMQWGESEGAAEELNRVRTARQEDEKRLEDTRAYLTHDSLGREARRRAQEASERLTRVEEQRRHQGDLLREVPEREHAATVLRAKLKDLEAQLSHAREAQQILQRLEELHHEVDELTHDLAALDRCHAELQQCREEMARLPLRQDEIHNAQALPREIKALEEELTRLEHRRQDVGQQLAQGEVEIVTASAAVHVAQTRRRALDEAVRRGQQEAQVEAERQVLRQTLQQQRALCAQVEILEAEIQRLDEALARTTALDAVDGARLAQLPTQIDQLEQLLLAEGFEVTLEPFKPVDVHAEQDGAATDHPALTSPLRLQAQQELTLHLHQIATVRVANRSRASVQLSQLREELAQHLAQTGTTSVHEYVQRRRERDRQLQHLESAQQQLVVLLSGTSLTQIQHSLAALEGQLAQLSDVGASREPPLPSVQDLAQELAHATAAEAEARDRLSRAVATVEVLRAQDHAPGAGDTLRLEVQRKQEVLRQLLQKASATSIEALTTLQRGWEEGKREEERLRAVEASILSGRREADMRSRVGRLQPEEEALRRRLAGLGVMQRTRAEMDYLEAECRRLSEEGDRLDRLYRTAQAELQALPGEALEQEQRRCLVELATAEHEAHTHEPFELTAEQRIRYERLVRELEAAVNDGRVQLGRLEEQARRADNLLSRVSELEETLAELYRHREHLLQRVAVDDQVRTWLETARKQAISDIYARLPAAVEARTVVMTGGAHSRVEGEGLDLALWSPRKGGSLEEEELSRGTRDQFYLALRLTLLDLLFGDARPPLLLDDPLVHCDPFRRREVISLLADYARCGQVLLFTCHTFPEYQGYPTLQLA